MTHLASARTAAVNPASQAAWQADRTLSLRACTTLIGAASAGAWSGIVYLATLIF